MQGQLTKNSMRNVKQISSCLAGAVLFAIAGTFFAGHASADELDIPEIRDDLTPKDLLRVQKVVMPTSDFSKAEAFEKMQGGKATSLKAANRDAYSHFSPNLKFAEEEQFKLGNALFRKLWVSSPSSTQASDGLGPLFNARACQSCHLKDGRGHPPEGQLDRTSMFLRLAKAPSNDAEIQALADFTKLTINDPTYGGQLQDLAVPGLSAEGRMEITYQEIPVTFGDGMTASLRKPTYSVSNLSYGALHPDTTLSPRVTPQMIGLGLLEAIHPSDIIANADPDDTDDDGISGRISITRDPVTAKKTLGRFGWKASNASIRQQSAGAFAGDIGISSPDVPNSHGDCTKAQQACLKMPVGVQKRLGDVEAPDPVLGLVTFYSQNLAVPARRDFSDASVLKGKELFYAWGCVSCHKPKFVTSRKTENHAQAFQLIWPYTDMLLHDMGEGLADGQIVGSASGREWRTAPLWGIGLTETVNGHTFFLHDGRARNLGEAVLWHGGEAQAASDSFAASDKEDRDNLIKFLESL